MSENYIDQCCLGYIPWYIAYIIPASQVQVVQKLNAF